MLPGWVYRARCRDGLLRSATAHLRFPEESRAARDCVVIGYHRHGVSGALPHLACASSHEMLRSSSDHEDASRAELHAPKIGACVSPAPLSSLSKYRLFTLPSLQRWSPRSCRLSGWLQVIGKGLYSDANCILAPIEHLRTSNMLCKTILWVTPMPTSTLS